MKLTIDTKEDSHEDIRKVIRMLQHLVGENTSGAVLSEPSPEAASAFSNIFGEDSPALGDSSKVKNIDEDREEVPDKPEIIPY